jgi:hypothetical protein
VDVFDEAVLDACAGEIAAFERDGYAVLPAVMASGAQRAWAEALRELQAQNDACARAVLLPLFPAPPDDPARFLGGSQLILGQQNPDWTARPERWAAVAAARHKGVIPEYFPVGHSPFLWGVCRQLTLDARLMPDCQSGISS